MFNLNLTISIIESPFKREGVDALLLTKVEEHLGETFRNKSFRLSHLDYRELPKQGNKRRFHVNKAYGVGDK